MRRPLLLMLTAALFPACSSDAPQTAPPHVLFVVLDALSAGHVHHLGYERETTPVLDALAAEGASFEQLLAPAPYTLASIPSMLTGRLPDTHGVVQKNRGALPDSEVTLAEYLKAAGYQTFGATANANAGPNKGADQGFDEFIEVYLGEGPPGAQLVPRPEGSDMPVLHMPRATEFEDILAGFLERREAQRPGLFYLHILEPHSPYDPPEPFRDLWLDSEYSGPFFQGSSQALISAMHGLIPIGDEDRQAARDLYDANLVYVDQVLGRLCDQLRAAGLWENTLVVVTSDHGEAFWQHGRWGHNDHLYDEMVHVPLVVRWPANAQGPAAGTRVKALASLMDVAPSVIEWTGTAADPEALRTMDGISLQPLLDGGGGGKRELLLRTNALLPSLSLRTEDSHLVVMRHGEPGKYRFETELYDLRADTGQQSDLAKAGTLTEGLAKRSAQLQELSRNLRVRTQRNEPDLNQAYDAFLDALGYGGD
ncbi:MAG: arylsulfatase A-like enzyme [Planctomycetota bacterium]|jgi:arylsulfatase A-like enzyme